MNSQILNATKPEDNSLALFRLGFRPFFLGAGVFSILAMLLWALLYRAKISIPLDTLSSYQWHAHEMLYGYSLAVISGFLLAAVKNWTGVQTLRGMPLAILFLLWVAARLSFSFAGSQMPLTAFFDLLFMVVLCIAIAIPIFRAGQWKKQIGILAKLVLLTVFNLLFYLGLAGYVDQGIEWGLYGALYLVIGLILMMGRRVVPFFIERGVDSPVQLSNSVWLDRAGLFVFVIFFVAELFVSVPHIAAIAAFAVFAINAVRLVGWYTPGIWSKPLLWSLYFALLSITVGFLLLGLSYYTELSKYLAIHAFAVGGIGLMTLSMMSRVTLGHTGRAVNAPPKLTGISLTLLALAVVTRVGLPLIASNQYALWIEISQTLWIAGFGLFVLMYAPMLFQARVDGAPG
ncbi:MAG: NnrS family protein [Gammaproteobacteria bacterium]